jgi:hypothetical protein
MVGDDRAPDILEQFLVKLAVAVFSERVPGRIHIQDEILGMVVCKGPSSCSPVVCTCASSHTWLAAMLPENVYQREAVGCFETIKKTSDLHVERMADCNLRSIILIGRARNEKAPTDVRDGIMMV